MLPQQGAILANLISFTGVNSETNSEKLNCAPGFELIEGDIGGRGPLGYLENVHTSEECAMWCLSKARCLSYEWSPGRKACNLNDKSNPNRPQYRDFRFCQMMTYDD